MNLVTVQQVFSSGENKGKKRWIAFDVENICQLQTLTDFMKCDADAIAVGACTRIVFKEDEAIMFVTDQMYDLTRTIKEIQK